MNRNTITLLSPIFVLASVSLLTVAPLQAQLVTNLTWIRTGGPRGGLGYDVRMDPRLPGMIYATDAHGGAFMSTDDGLNFVPINNGITDRAGASGDKIPVFSLTIDPHDKKIFWAGTQTTAGIFKSTDGGRSWVEMTNGVATDRGLCFRGFTVDPRTSGIVYAQAEIPSWGWTPDGSMRLGRQFDMTKGIVYKTTDGGAHWRAIWEGDHMARYLWIDPRNPDVLYVSTGFFDREAANSDPTKNEPGGVGILKSIDAGQTWRVLNQANGLTGLYITSLFMKPDNPDVLLAATGVLSYASQREGAGQGGVYLTENGGETWRKVIDPYTRSDIPPDYSIFTTVEYCLSDLSVVYADGLAGFYRSLDGGQTWTMLPAQLPPGVRQGVSIDMMCDPTNTDRLFVNLYGGGNTLTEDGGRTFVDASHGYTGAQVKGLAVDPQRPARVYAALRDGVWVSNDSGDDWDGRTYGIAEMGEFTELAIDPAGPARLLAASGPDGVLLATDNGGMNWTLVANARAFAPENDRDAFSAIAFAPSDHSRVYAGTAGMLPGGLIVEPHSTGTGIFVSNDGGRTWQAPSMGSNPPHAVIAIAVHPQNGDIVLASTGRGEILKSSDGGRSWAVSDTGPWSSPAGGEATQRYITAWAFDPRQPDRVLAGTNVAALYESLDQGTTWQRSDTGLPPEGVITAIVTSGDGDWFLATKESGGFQRRAGDSRWQQINAGLEMREINRLAITSDGQHLYAATEGWGVYRLDLNREGRAPFISQIRSKSGTPGSRATIVGSRFSATKRNNRVYFGGQSAKIRRATATSLQIVIPKRLRSGSVVEVFVRVNGVRSNEVRFTLK